MLRRPVVFAIAVLILIGAAGCGGKDVKKADPPAKLPKESSAPPGSGPASPDLKETAEKILKLTESEEWARLYDYLYADVQKTISKEDFVNARKNSKMSYRNYKIGEPRIVPEWRDNINGKTYKDVAEIPYTVDVVTERGEIKVNNIMHLIKTPENDWRYLWIRK